MVRFLVVPQWQGSSSSRAMQLIDGAHAILGDLPRSGSRIIEVSLEAGDALGTGVARMSALGQTARNLRDALTEHRERSQAVITVGGDAGVATIAALHAAEPDVAVIWFTARAAFDSPSPPRNRAFHDMAARALIDPAIPLPDATADADAGTPVARLRPGQLSLVGVRGVAAEQLAAIAAHGVNVYSPQTLDPGELVAQIRASGASRAFIHIDLNVLDPAVLAGLGLVEPFGLELDQLLETIGVLRNALPLVGAAITEYSPSSPDAVTHDMSSILRIVSALA